MTMVKAYTVFEFETDLLSEICLQNGEPLEYLPASFIVEHYMSVDMSLTDIAKLAIEVYKE
jgi:hypothetical protein